MRYKLIIFDFDGTLADSFAWLTSAIPGAADKYHFTRPAPEQIEAMRGLSAGRIIKQLGVPFWKVPLIAGHLRTQMARDIHQIRLFKGVDQLLHTLSAQGLVLAVVSANSLANVRAVLGEKNAACIQHYACGVSISGKKTRFKKILKTARVLPAATLCIGDEIRDIEAARAAGVPCGAVTWGYTRPEALRAQKPDVVFESIEEIIDRLT